jgi:rhodanese-related sulfurtransferase
MNTINWKQLFGRATVMVLAAVLLGFAVNVASPNRIAWEGTWPSTYSADSVAIPPSYEETDPPILRLDEAIAKYQSHGVVFLDARDEMDFEYGHIPRAINFPFDYYDDFAPLILPGLELKTDIVTYCGGADCELSLYLARQLVNEGYESVSIFFGGYTAWEEAGLPMAPELEQP